MTMADTKLIYFAGGCFWGTEHFFSGVDGVVSAVSGYAQGSPEFEGRPSYEQVYTDTTGFAETVRVCYRPERISLETLADLFFSIIDPLSLNRQGHDEGTRYRTGIYYSDPADLPVLQGVYSAVEARIGQPLVVELEPLRNFFEAEERHQLYLDKNTIRTIWTNTLTAIAICLSRPLNICVCIRMLQLSLGMSRILLPVWPRPLRSSTKG